MMALIIYLAHSKPVWELWAQKNLKDMQQIEVVIAPSLLTEGKVYQKAQQLGMGK